MALSGLGHNWRNFYAHSSDAVLDLLLGGDRTCNCLDRCVGLLHRQFVAVLRRQCAVALLSELVARRESGWARELTRHPRSRQVALPS